MKRFLVQNVAFRFPENEIFFLKGTSVRAVIEIESSVTDGTDSGL
jgi:hypothetical protein